jgi:hypothetical protein
MTVIFVIIGVTLIRMIIHIGLVLVRVRIAGIGVVVHFLLAIAIIRAGSHRVLLLSAPPQ